MPETNNEDEVKKPKKEKIKPLFSIEAIAASGGIIGLLTLILLIYQNLLMANQTDQMTITNTEIVVLREMEQRQRLNRLIELLYDEGENSGRGLTSYKRVIRYPKYNSKLRTEAFHEMFIYLKSIGRKLDFTGGLLGGMIDFREGDFSEIDLSMADIKHANLSSATFDGANFSFVDLLGSDLRNSSIQNANLSSSMIYQTKLAGANFTGSSFKDAVFREVDLTQVDLSKTDLSGTIFTEVDFEGVKLTGAKYNVKTVWPEGFDLSSNKDQMILIKNK